jgi:hypothetical protein
MAQEDGSDNVYMIEILLETIPYLQFYPPVGGRPFSPRIKNISWKRLPLEE